MCKRKKKAMSPRHSTYIPSSVKWPFWDLEDDIGLGGGGFHSHHMGGNPQWDGTILMGKLTTRDTM